MASTRTALFTGGALLAVFSAFSPACSGAAGDNDVKGGTGGSGTGGSGASIGVDGSAASGGVGGSLAGCGKDTYTGELVPLDMLVMLDRSGSMSTADNDAGPSRWTQVTGAINEFMGLPGTTQIALGIDFFPLQPSQPPPTQCQTAVDCAPYDYECPFGSCLGSFGESDSCVASDYSTPAVPIAALPGVASAITVAMGGMSPSGGTPMAPALEGAIGYAQQWSAQNPDHITIVVLATDGSPTGCNPNEVDTVAARAEWGQQQNPAIKTFVIGIGQNLTSLNAIAAAGGTNEAVIVDAANAGGEFLAALNLIRGSVGCTYRIPAPTTGEQPSPNLVNLGFTPEGAGLEIIPRVGSEADCQGQAGWFYDDPNDPGQIILCPASCDRVQNVKGQVDVVVGCESIPR